MAAVLLAGACSSRDTESPAALSPSSAAVTGGPSGDVTCNSWVSTQTGADKAGNGTTRTAPFKTIQYALAAARGIPAGLHTLCVPSGQSLTLSEGGTPAYEISRSNTVLAGEPGVSPKPVVQGQLTTNGSDITIRGLQINNDQRSGRGAATVRLWGNRVSLLDSGVSGLLGTCVEVGFLDADVVATEPPTSPSRKATNVVVKGNDLGPCVNLSVFFNDGLFPNEQVWTCERAGNSGLPAVYSQWADGLEVSENVLHDTPLRGMQLYPKNRNVNVLNNLFRRTSIPINVGTDANGKTADIRKAAGRTHEAANIVIEGSIFAEQSSLSWADQYFERLRLPGCFKNRYLTNNSRPDVSVDDESTEYASELGHPEPTVKIRGNCGEAARKDTDNDPTSVFEWTNNRVENNLESAFVSVTDDHQTSSSPCKAVGPTRLRFIDEPQPPKSIVVTPPATGATGAIGELVRQTFTLKNAGPNPASLSVVATMPAVAPIGTKPTAAAPIAYGRLQGAVCESKTTCEVKLAAGESKSITAVYAPVYGYSTPLVTTLTAGSASATTKTEISGSYCAAFGTAGDDTGKTLEPPNQTGAIVCGFEGNDTLYPTGGSDRLIGGDGVDTVDYSKAVDTPKSTSKPTKPWAIDLGAKKVNQIPPYPSSADYTDTLESIESATGSAFNDVITGNSGANVLNGGPGNDTLNGGAGNDSLVGGTGNDTLNGGLGDDAFNFGASSESDAVSYAGTADKVTIDLGKLTQVTGGAGKDTFAAAPKNVVGGNGNDVLTGDSAVNKILGGPGNDTIKGAGGNDVLNGDAGDDAIDGGAGTDTCAQGAGSGRLTACEK